MVRRGSGCLLLALVVLLVSLPVEAQAARSDAPVPPVLGVAGWAGNFSYFNVRAAPELGAAVVGTVRWGQRVPVLAAAQGSTVAGSDVWYEVRLGARTGYVHSSGISYLSGATRWTGETGVSATSQGSDVTTYAQPQSGAAAEASFAPGTLMTVLGLTHGAALQAGDDVWYRVSTGSYRPAYLYSADLTFARDGAGPVPRPILGAAAAVAVDMDSMRVLYSRNADTPRPTASLAKMMTAAVALDRVASDTIMTVPAGAPSVGAAIGGTAMGLVPGERLSLRDLLWGLLLPSGNDAAYTIAQNVAGSQAAFADLMNAKAAALGLTGTHFVQSYGLDAPGEYSTAWDLARLARYDLGHYPLFDQIVGTAYHYIGPGPTHPAFALHNLDRLLGVYPGAFGVKTGTTPAAGQNLVSAVHRDGRRILVVVLGSADRYADATALLNYAVAVEKR